MKNKDKAQPRSTRITNRSRFPTEEVVPRVRKMKKKLSQLRQKYTLMKTMNWNLTKKNEDLSRSNQQLALELQSYKSESNINHNNYVQVLMEKNELQELLGKFLAAINGVMTDSTISLLNSSFNSSHSQQTPVSSISPCTTSPLRSKIRHVDPMVQAVSKKKPVIPIKKVNERLQAHMPKLLSPINEKNENSENKNQHRVRSKLGKRSQHRPYMLANNINQAENIVRTARIESKEDDTVIPCPLQQNKSGQQQVDPLAGPSWLLDVQNSTNIVVGRRKLKENQVLSNNVTVRKKDTDLDKRDLLSNEIEDSKDSSDFCGFTAKDIRKSEIFRQDNINEISLNQLKDCSVLVNKLSPATQVDASHERPHNSRELKGSIARSSKLSRSKKRKLIDSRREDKETTDSPVRTRAARVKYVSESEAAINGDGLSETRSTGAIRKKIKRKSVSLLNARKKSNSSRSKKRRSSHSRSENIESIDTPVRRHYSRVSERDTSRKKADNTNGKKEGRLTPQKRQMKRDLVRPNYKE